MHGARFPLAGVACEAAAVGSYVRRARADPTAAMCVLSWACGRSRICVIFGVHSPTRQSFAGTSRVRIRYIVPLEMYPLNIKIRAVCESSKSGDHARRNGLAVAVQQGLP